MKITPLDIHHKKFKTGFKGYNVDEVDKFLDAIASQLDVLFKENAAMKDKMNESEALVSKYKNLEGALNSALVNAQKLAEEVVAKATAEAGDIVGKARREAKEIFETSVEQRNELMQSIKRLQKLDEDSKTRLLNVLDDFTNIIQDAEPAVDEAIMSKEENLSEQLDDFMRQAEEAEVNDQTEAANVDEADEASQAEVEPQVIAEEVIEPVVEPDEVSIPAQETSVVDEPTENVTAESIEEAPAAEKVIEIKTDNLISTDENSLSLTANGHTQEFAPEDNPFADLGEGVPGAIRRKKKIND